MREGLLPATVATVLELSTSGEKARALTELLGEVFDPSETAISAFEIEDGVTTLSLNAPWKVEIYFATHPDETARVLVECARGEHRGAECENAREGRAVIERNARMERFRRSFE